MRMQPGPHARGRCGAAHGPRGDAGNALLDPEAPSPAEDLGEDAAFLLDERWDSDEDCQRAKRGPPGCDSCLRRVALPSQPLGVLFGSECSSHLAWWRSGGFQVGGAVNYTGPPLQHYEYASDVTTQVLKQTRFLRQAQGGREQQQRQRGGGGRPGRPGAGAAAAPGHILQPHALAAQPVRGRVAAHALRGLAVHGRRGVAPGACQVSGSITPWVQTSSSLMHTQVTPGAFPLMHTRSSMPNSHAPVATLFWANRFVGSSISVPSSMCSDPPQAQCISEAVRQLLGSAAHRPAVPWTWADAPDLRVQAHPWHH